MPTEGTSRSRPTRPSSPRPDSLCCGCLQTQDHKEVKKNKYDWLQCEGCRLWCIRECLPLEVRNDPENHTWVCRHCAQLREMREITSELTTLTGSQLQRPSLPPWVEQEEELRRLVREEVEEAISRPTGAIIEAFGDLQRQVSDWRSEQVPSDALERQTCALAEAEEEAQRLDDEVTRQQEEIAWLREQLAEAHTKGVAEGRAKARAEIRAAMEITEKGAGEPTDTPAAPDQQSVSTTPALPPTALPSPSRPTKVPTERVTKDNPDPRTSHRRAKYTPEHKPPHHTRHQKRKNATPPPPPPPRARNTHKAAPKSTPGQPEAPPPPKAALHPDRTHTKSKIQESLLKLSTTSTRRSPRRLQQRSDDQPPKQHSRQQGRNKGPKPQPASSTRPPKRGRDEPTGHPKGHEGKRQRQLPPLPSSAPSQPRPPHRASIEDPFSHESGRVTFIGDNLFRTIAMKWSAHFLRRRWDLRIIPDGTTKQVQRAMAEVVKNSRSQKIVIYAGPGAIDSLLTERDWIVQTKKADERGNTLFQTVAEQVMNKPALQVWFWGILPRGDPRLTPEEMATWDALRTTFNTALDARCKKTNGWATCIDTQGTPTQEFVADSLEKDGRTVKPEALFEITRRCLLDMGEQVMETNPAEVLAKEFLPSGSCTDCGQPSHQGRRCKQSTHPECGRCGTQGHHSVEQCHYRWLMCPKCGLRGHKESYAH